MNFSTLLMTTQFFEIVRDRFHPGFELRKVLVDLLIAVFNVLAQHFYFGVVCAALVGLLVKIAVNAIAEETNQGNGQKEREDSPSGLIFARRALSQGFEFHGCTESPLDTCSQVEAPVLLNVKLEQLSGIQTNLPALM